MFGHGFGLFAAECEEEFREFAEALVRPVVERGFEGVADFPACGADAFDVVGALHFRADEVVQVGAACDWGQRVP